MHASAALLRSDPIRESAPREELPEPEEGADPTGGELFSDLGSSMMSRRA